jgi:hypothetical protein
MWNSAPSMATLGTWGLWLTAIFGALAIVAGLIGGIAANRAADIITQEADARIASANERAERARARAEEARMEAAKITERLRRVQEIRRLTPGQTSALEYLFRSELFQSDPKPILRVSAVDDAEAQMYAMDFQRLFQACGVNIYPTNRGLPNECVQLGPHASGLVLNVKSLATTVEARPYACFQRAMHAVGLEVTMQVDDSLRPNEGILCVLRKPAVT